MASRSEKSDPFSSLRALEQELREIGAALQQSHDPEDFTECADKLAACLAALPTQWDDGVLSCELQVRDDVPGAIFYGPAFELEPPATGKARSGYWRELKPEERLLIRAALGSPSEAWQPGQPNVIVRCVTCGREIWQEVPDYTTFEQARAAECSDCFLERIAPPARPADTRKDE